MKMLLGMVIGGLLVALGMGVAKAGAQNPSLTPTQITLSVPCTGNQDVSLAGQATYCFGTDGAFVSLNGAAPTPLGGSAAAPTLTLNGTKKTLPASFTIAAAAPTVSAPTATAPVITAQ